MTATDSSVSHGRVTQAWRSVQTLWRRTAPAGDNPAWDAELRRLQRLVPAPTFWLFGKTQSGKTSVIRTLTGAADAEIGSGFRPCTRTSRLFPFPVAETPVMSFLDTRGVDEPSYDPAEDIAAFEKQAHLIIVTCRLRDFATGSVRDSLAQIRKAWPHRPAVLVLTCLHEAYPQTQHPAPYPFRAGAGIATDVTTTEGVEAPADLLRLVREQAALFAGLVDRVVPVDFTKPEEGFDAPDYGAAFLKETLLTLLPSALRATFGRATEVGEQLKAMHLEQAHPLIVAYAAMAAAAGAIPVPGAGMVTVPAIQARMVQKLAELYREPMTGERFLATMRALGPRILGRQLVREAAKFIPFVGAAAGAAVAGQSTYALGLAFCEYYQAAHQGHLPSADALKKLYRDQLDRASKSWA